MLEFRETGFKPSDWLFGLKHSDWNVSLKTEFKSNGSFQIEDWLTLDSEWWHQSAHLALFDILTLISKFILKFLWSRMKELKLCQRNKERDKVQTLACWSFYTNVTLLLTFKLK